VSHFRQNATATHFEPELPGCAPDFIWKRKAMAYKP